MLEKVNLAQKFSQIHDHWNPRLVAELNGQHVRLAKVKGEFVWHHHEEEDELFLIVEGHLVIELRDGRIELGPGELCVIPSGVEHRPVAQEEVHLLLFEPAATLNTGNVQSERTRHVVNRL